MMRDINDQAWRADLLADVLTSYGDWGWVHVNLIPLNPTPGSKWTASRREDEREFVRRLEAKGVPTTVRDTRGSRDRRRLRPARGHRRGPRRGPARPRPDPPPADPSHLGRFRRRVAPEVTGRRRP